MVLNKFIISNAVFVEFLKSKFSLVLKSED